MKFSEAKDKFQAWKSIRNERASVTYVWEVNKFERFIKKELGELDQDDVISYQSFMKTKYSDATQAIAAQALRSFFQFTQKRGVSQIDPLEISVPRIEEKVPVYVVQGEFETLCDIAQYQNPVILLAIRLLWFTGVRVSELCDIKVAQVDLREKCAKIATRKSFRPKTVFWDDQTNDLLEGLLRFHREEYVFASPKGGKISTRQVERWIQAVIKKANFKKHITPHSFRHGATKEWLNNGVDLPAIKDLLGHKNLLSIEKYTKRLDDDIKEKGREAVRQRVVSIKYAPLKLFKSG